MKEYPESLFWSAMDGAIIFPRNLSILSLVLTTLLGHAHGFWRMNCAKVQVGRIDPLVSPNSVSSHSHTIVGANSM